MKQKLLFLLVLLLTATTGAWAQSAFTAKEITSASQLTSTDDGAYVAACMPSDFLAVDADVAKAWTGAPDGLAFLIYAIDENKIKMARFLNGSNNATFGETWSIATFKDQLPNAKFFYTAAPTYSVTLAEGTEDDTNWTISPTEAAEGDKVTVTYSGEKKVKSVKAVKKAPAGPTAYTLAESTVGMIVGSDGKAYAVADKDNLPDGVKAEALVCYVDGNGHGLALALTDEEGTMNWSTAQTTCDAHTPAITGGTWKLASKNEWNSMITAAGSYSALRDGFSSVGGTNMQSVGYWSSTEDDSSDAWNYYFSNGLWSDVSKNWKRYVRACLAF